MCVPAYGFLIEVAFERKVVMPGDMQGAGILHQETNGFWPCLNKSAGLNFSGVAMFHKADLLPLSNARLSGSVDSLDL